MANQYNSQENQPYDKILKENIGQLFLPITEKHLNIQIKSSEELKDKLQTTLEREADFLRKITTSQGDTFILHLEFQSTDETDMVYRMQEYHAILQKKYKIPIRQFVFYLGGKPSKMKTKLDAKEVFTGFERLTFHTVNYEDFLDSNIPEEVVLALLADFGEMSAQDVIQKILLRLLQLKEEPILLEKYIRQMVMLARLRQNLNEILETQLSIMALTYDIEKDTLYKKGLKKGREETLSEVKTAGIHRALQQGKLTIEEIATLFEVSVEFVLKLKQKNAD